MEIDALICRGHRAASGTAASAGAAYKGGTLRCQHPFFLRCGLNLSEQLKAEPYWGTLNCYIGQSRIDPVRYTDYARQHRGLVSQDTKLNPVATRWDIKLRDITWHATEKAENFFFLKGHIRYGRITKPCYVYFPNPIGQRDMFHLLTVLEIIAPPLPFKQERTYGEKVTLDFPGRRLAIVKGTAQRPRLTAA